MEELYDDKIELNLDIIEYELTEVILGGIIYFALWNRHPHDKKWRLSMLMSSQEHTKEYAEETLCCYRDDWSKPHGYNEEFFKS